MLPGRYAVVDLATRCVEVRELPAAWRRSFLGGRGLNVLLLARHLPRGVEPFSDANVLVLGAGPLAGTRAPGSGRTHVTFKSPETGILGDGSIGGGFGAAMRGAGFDHVVLTGRAEEPALLRIAEGVEVRDARRLWGLDALAVQAALRGEGEALCIGPAGERLVRFASVRAGAGRSARCGGGAVLGSKLLKAVVARAARAVPVADAELLEARSRALDDRLAGSRGARLLEREGTAVYYDSANAMGVLRALNGQRSSWDADYGAWPAGERPEFSVLGLLGPNLGMRRRGDVLRLAAVCNELGLDASSAGGYLAWAIELFQRGLIGEALTGEPMRWGDAALCERLLRACAAREGFGNVLAEGSQAVRLGYYPAEALRFFPGVKGLPQSDATDVRFGKGFALGLAVASRGADHLRNRPGFEWFLGMRRDAKEAEFGPGAGDPAQAVARSEDLYAVVDSLGVSKLLASGLNAPGLLGLAELAPLAEAACGEALDLRGAGARIADLERWLNLREGLTRAHDTLPARCFDEPLPDGLARGARIDRAEFARLLDAYYAARGWREDGTLPRGPAARGWTEEGRLPDARDAREAELLALLQA